jgi:acyl carrier protein
MSNDEIKDHLISFIREKFLGGDPKNELDGQTPLLQWGILDSLNTAVLVNHMQAEMRVEIPPAAISARNFKTVDDITSLVAGLSADQQVLGATNEQ